MDHDVIKSLKGIIQGKVQEKLYNMPPELQSYCKNCILTGGAITSLYHVEEPNDYDLFFNFSVDMLKVKVDVSNMYYNIIPSPWISDITTKYFKDPDVDYKGDGTKAVTDWAVTLTNSVQLVFKTAEYRKGFDFIHCMPYYDIMRDKLYISPHQYDCIVRKKLVINPAHSQPIVEKRIKKYTDRGWTI